MSAKKSTVSADNKAGQLAKLGYPIKLVRRPHAYPNPENPMGSTKTKGSK